MTSPQDRARLRAALTEPGEEWRPIPNFDGAYELSNLGRVLSWKIWHGGPPPPRLMRVTTPRDGRPIIQLGLHGGTHRIDHLIESIFPELSQDPKP